MNSLRFLVFGLFVVCVLVTVQAQTDGAQQQVSPKQESEHNPHFLGVLPESIPQTISPGEKASPQQIELTLPRATPIQIELSARARIGREGEPVVGKVTNAIYAFDQPVIPAGSEVRGHLARVVPVSKKRRVMAIADADFSPPHDYTVTLDTIILSDGRRVPVVTTAARGTREVVHLTSDPTRPAAKKKNAAARVTDSAKEEVKDTFHHAVTEVKSPGRIHRIKQFLLAQLPYRRQYLEPGTRFDADLESPLDFGSTARLPGQLRSIGTEPVPNSTLRARLTDEVTSATASGGTPIEAVITEPVFNTDGQLVLPANSRIVGEVTQAKPAGKLHHNGELRIVFEKIATPDGKTQSVQGNLEGVEVDRAANMKLDTEGGAHTTDSGSRYFSTGLAIVVAAAAAHPESDNGASDGAADPAARTVAGGSGFKLVGAVMGLASGSKAFSSVLGVYGASRSVYSHFLSRGKDIVLPKDTQVEIIFGKSHSSMERSTKAWHNLSVRPLIPSLNF